MAATVYLLPMVLADDDNAFKAIPQYALTHIQECTCFFVENERTARRYFKKLWKEMAIDDYEWHTIHKAENAVMQNFIAAVRNNKTIGIISEAGCAGIADPGQLLVHKAQELHVKVVPLVGPSSVLLALMASGMNGQQFTFNGYLPQETGERKKALLQLESVSSKQNATQIFIETPYRNKQMINDMLAVLHDTTLLCIAVNITASTESIKTKSIAEWKQETMDIHKQPAIFLIYAGS